MLRLCSSSETRAKLLDAFGIPFSVSPQFFDESSLTAADPQKFVYHATKGKMLSACAHYDFSLPILCADTVVCVGSTMMGKAANLAEARAYLELQSGNRVDIYSATFLWSEELRFEDLSVTTYFFDTFTQEDVRHYLESNEWMGKAGACMVEGFCKKYIRECVGTESCAMGLSVEKILPFVRL